MKILDIAVQGMIRPSAFAGALLRDNLRRPGAWAAAFACGAAVIASSLLLPYTDAVDRARLVGSFASGTIFFLACVGGAFLPAALSASNRQEKILDGWASLPRGAASSFAGSFLASVCILALWILLLLATGAVVLLPVLRDLPPGENPLAPRREVFPVHFEGKTLAPGGSTRLAFPPQAVAGSAKEDVEGLLEVRLFLARPDSPVFGAPLSIRLLAPDGTPGEILASTSSLRSGALPFRVPAETAEKGAHLEIRFGPSPFNAGIHRTGIRLFGKRGSPWSSFLLAGFTAFLAALLVAAFSSAASTFLSLPVALLLAGWVFLAGSLSAPAGEALIAWEHMGLMKAKEGIPDLPSWFGSFRTLVKGMIVVLPDLGSMNHASDFASGRGLSFASLLAALFQTAIYGLPALLIGTLVSRTKKTGGTSSRPLPFIASV